jgi:hypothetical protein
MACYTLEIGDTMDKLLGAFIWLRARLNEPSTHASLAAVFGLLGMHVNMSVVSDILNVAALGFGVIGFWTKEAQPLTRI